VASLFINVAQLIRRVGARTWVLSLTVAVGVTAGDAYARLAPPNYTARAYVVVVAADPGDAGAAVNFAQAYARIAGQGDVLGLAVSATNATTTMDELSRDVRAASSPDAPMIEVTASATSGPRAALLANAVANGLIATAARQNTTTRMSLSMLSVAIPPTDVTSPPRPRIGVAIGAGAGLLLGILLLLAGADRVLTRVLTRADRALTGRFGRRTHRSRHHAAPSEPAARGATTATAPAVGAVGPIAARLGGDGPTLPAPPRGPRDDAEPSR
jgi:capsular polysaccharide biosynthesis protein